MPTTLTRRAGAAAARGRVLPLNRDSMGARYIPSIPTHRDGRYSVPAATRMEAPRAYVRTMETHR